MRIAIIAVIALLLLGGGGAGAYFFLLHPAEASVGKTPEHQEAKEEKEVNKELFVTLDPLILPIIGSHGVSQTVSLVIVIEVADEKQAEIVKTLTPRLKDAYIQDMYGVLSRKNVMPNGTLDVGMIKERLNHISRDVLGEGVVKDVLLQVVQQHPV